MEAVRSTVTSLDWLDLTVTQGINPGDVYAQLRTITTVGSDWRFATESEVVDFVTRNMGAEFGVGYSAGTPEAIAADRLINLLGVTYASSSPYYLDYFSAGWFVTGSNSLEIMEIENERDTFEASRINRSFTWSSPNGTGVGSLMVRATVVPIPAAGWLLATGLGLLGWRSKIRVAA